MAGEEEAVKRTDLQKAEKGVNESAVSIEL
jgi:hypothetical protein